MFDCCGTLMGCVLCLWLLVICGVKMLGLTILEFSCNAFLLFWEFCWCFGFGSCLDWLTTLACVFGLCGINSRCRYGIVLSCYWRWFALKCLLMTLMCLWFCFVCFYCVCTVLVWLFLLTSTVVCCDFPFGLFACVDCCLYDPYLRLQWFCCLCWFKLWLFDFVCYCYCWLLFWVVCFTD